MSGSEQDFEADVSGDPEVSGPRRPGLLAASALLIGILGMLAAVLLPFAPVVAEETTITWPQAGKAPESTTAWFVPYAPAEVQVDVPCSAVRAGLDRAEPTTVVGSTAPGNRTRGFTVVTDGGDVLVLIGGREVYRGAASSGGCSVGIDAGSGGSRVCVGDDCRDLPGDRVREVFSFSTDLPPEQAEGMRVHARTGNWFENSPTIPKIVLIAASVVLAAVAFTLLIRGDRWRRASRASRSRKRWRGGWGRWGIDLSMLGVFGLWVVLGPRTPDDSFTEGIVRNALDTGAFTNYYRWENAAESPFTLALHLVQPLVALQANPLLLRVPSAVMGLLTWMLISRGSLPVLLPNHVRLLWVRGLAAVGLLLWWLPFNLGVRPEPFVALGVTAVLTCVLRATARVDGAGLALLGLGGLALGLTVAVNPVGVVAVAPILLLAPRVWRTLGGAGSGRRPSRVVALGWLAAVGSLAALGLVAMFVDQSWYGVTQATELHRFYGPNVSWFEEIRRYEYLLAFGEQRGGMGRRLPVLTTLALVPGAALVLARGARALPGLHRSTLAVCCFVLALGLLWLTPSKWTHYFGALAGLGAVSLTTSVVLLCVAARHWVRQRGTMMIGVSVTALVVLAASVSFSGENTWFLYSYFGVPNEDGPFRPLNNPFVWVLLALLVLVSARLSRRRDQDSVRGWVARMPAVLGSVVAVSGVAVLLVSFIVAPAAQTGSYSVGGQNLRHLAGGGCGIADHIVTTRDAPGGVLKAAGDAKELKGFTAFGGYPEKSVPPAKPGTGSAEYLWGSQAEGTVSTGRMVSQWFTLPDLGKNQELAMWVAGRTGDGNRLAVEFGRSTEEQPRPTGERVLDDAYKDSDERPTYPSDRVVEDEPQDTSNWRTLYVDSSEVPAGSDRVRVRAVDATTDAGGWIAVTGPRVRDVAPLRPYLSTLRSVYVDWSMVWDVPCVRQSPRVADGMVEAPTALLIPPARLGFDGQASFERDVGGSFAGIDEVGRRRTVPTRLLGTEDKPDYEDWGQLVRVSYPMLRDAYDKRTVGVIRWGWEGDRPPLGYPSR